MKLKLILPAASAVALAAAAMPAAAQMGHPDQQGEMENRATPSSGVHSKTGLPSVDSTRATGERQGYTTMPDGKITGDTQDAVNPPNMSARTGMSADTSSSSGMSSDARMMGDAAGYEAQSATRAGAMASDTGAIINYELVTNGPIPDTPENREQFGGPISQAGKATAPRGN